VNKSDSNFYLAESNRFKVKVGVFLVLIHENKLLCLRGYNTGVHDGLYVVPMVGLDEGETPLQAVVREAREEVNIILKVSYSEFRFSSVESLAL
jgi:8-oxo-dGTP pyrophosphatase MutT (NUDIX family)